MSKQQIQYRIRGEDVQIVEIGLPPSASVIAEPGAMVYMDNSVEMSVGVEGTVVQALLRRWTGESFLMPRFTNQGDQLAVVGFAAPFPGQVISLRLPKLGGEIYCQKGSFLCATTDVGIDIGFTKKVGAGLFGRQGFILQRLHGQGLAFIHGGGTVIERDLEEGEVIRVDISSLAAFSATVTYDVNFVGGLGNVFFAGEGKWITKLTGPGKVFIQSVPFSHMIDHIHSHKG
jgi:uncharacterized protein (TIGR00266 family)